MNFTAVTTEIDNAMKEIVFAEVDEKTMKIAPEDFAGEGQFDEHFRCQVCTDVVFDPKQCSAGKCQKLVCDTCITDWLGKKDTCPNCSEKFEAVRNLSRFELNILNAYKFKCVKCKDTYTYAGAKDHFKECSKMFGCPLECDKEDTFLEKEDILDHLNDMCPKVPVNCNMCEKDTERGKKNDHKCSSDDLLVKNAKLQDEKK